MSESKIEVGGLVVSQFTMRDFNEIDSKLPANLVFKCTELEQYLFQRFLTNEAKIKWLAQHVVVQNEIIIAIAKRQNTGENWRLSAKIKWGIVLWILTSALTTIITIAIQHLIIPTH
jgi:hypothetical protein